MSNAFLFHKDCFEVMEWMKNKGLKVDMVFADLPYNETGNKWDSKIDHKKMFDYLRVLCKKEAPMVFTGTFRFGVELFNAAPDLYKYDWVWEKDNATNIVSANHQPLRIHENIYVFGLGAVSHTPRGGYMTYNPQKTQGKPYRCVSGRQSENWKGGNVSGFETNNESGLRHPKTIQYFCRDRGLHPTQKPLEMMEYLVKTYSNENDTVVDLTIGSGTTGVACIKLNRNFIGCEIDKKYFDIASKRMQETRNELESN